MIGTTILDKLRIVYFICRCCRNVATYKWKVHNGKVKIISFVVKFRSLFTLYQKNGLKKIEQVHKLVHITIEHITKIKSVPKPPKFFYRLLIIFQRSLKNHKKSQVKWTNFFFGAEIIFISDHEWSDIYLNAFKWISDTHVQSFQFKHNHIIVYTNKLLMKCKLSEISHCAFGNNTVEDIEHLFLDCHYTNYIRIYMLSCLRGNFNIKR